MLRWLGHVSSSREEQVVCTEHEAERQDVCLGSEGHHVSVNFTLELYSHCFVCLNVFSALWRMLKSSYLIFVVPAKFVDV